MRYLCATIAGAACIIAACSSSTSGRSPGTTSPPPAATSPAGSPSNALDGFYLHEIRKYLPDGGSRNLIAIGHAACAAFDDGATWVEEVNAFVAQGATGYKAGAAIATIVEVYCPEHNDLLPSH